MTILFDATRTVKPAARTFGRGILPTVAARRVPSGPSAADRAWAASELNRDSEVYEVVRPGYDVQAAETAAVDRLARGLCC